MAAAFVVGEKFRTKVSELLACSDPLACSEPALPPALREELLVYVDKSEETILPFSTARRLKLHLQAAGHPFFLHQLMEDSSLLLTEVLKPPRNPELEARLEKIKAKLANDDYKRMTRNVNTQDASRGGLGDIGQQVRSVKAVVVTVFNFLVTVGATFACSYMGSHYLFNDITARVLSAVIAASGVGLAELYVLVRTMEGDLGEL